MTTPAPLNPEEVEAILARAKAGELTGADLDRIAEFGQVVEGLGDVINALFDCVSQGLIDVLGALEQIASQEQMEEKPR